MKGYLASHFFNDAMFRWTEDLAQYIEKNTDLELYVPQRNADINDKKTNVTKIFYDIDIKGQWVKDVFTFLDEDFLIENFDFILTTEYKGNTALN